MDEDERRQFLREIKTRDPADGSFVGKLMLRCPGWSVQSEKDKALVLRILWRLSSQSYPTEKMREILVHFLPRQYSTPTGELSTAELLEDLTTIYFPSRIEEESGRQRENNQLL